MLFRSPTTGSANGVDPNHAWRHRLKTKLREAGVDSGTIDALCGHAPASVGAAYGAVTVRVKVAAVAQIKV